MNEDFLSEDKIKDLLLQFNLDESLNDLKRYYSTPTTWDIIHQARKETSHTQFLAWFFGNKEFNDASNAGPIQKLIVLLLKWARRQEDAQFDIELESSIYAQNFSIRSYDVVPEYPFSTQNYGKGYMDIFITCKAMVNEEPRNINIVIENKVDASETTKNKKELYQTDAYYEYVTTSKIFRGGINLFVLLKPSVCKLDDIDQTECNCKKYIQLNYQELLDNIIYPVSELKHITAEDSFRLKDYIKALGIPTETVEIDEKGNIKKKQNKKNRIITMAIDQKQKELLRKFFESNELLIRAAIDALDIPDLSEKMSEVDRRGVRRFYTIEGQGHYKMNDVLEEFVKFRLDSDASISVESIDEEIKSYIRTGSIIVTDNNSVELQAGRFKEFNYGDCNIRYSNQWSDSSPNDNFARFRTGVNKKYENFQIVEIISND